MDELVLQAQEEMQKRVEMLKASLTSLRTGRANPAMLNNINVDYYGTPTPVNQISSISVPEPRQLLIKPYDKNDCKSIVAAINASDLGINPINEGTQIRLMIPALTEIGFFFPAYTTYSDSFGPIQLTVKGMISSSIGASVGVAASGVVSDIICNSLSFSGFITIQKYSLYSAIVSPP